MIDGYFANDGKPYVEVRVSLPRFGVADVVRFLVDTGSDTTILHPEGAESLRCPFDELENPVIVAGIGGAQTYYAEPATLSFFDGAIRHDFRTDIYIAPHHPQLDELDSLLGRDVLNRLGMEYDFERGRLRFGMGAAAAGAAPAGQ